MGRMSVMKIEDSFVENVLYHGGFRLQGRNSKSYPHVQGAAVALTKYPKPLTLFVLGRRGTMESMAGAELHARVRVLQA